MKSSETFEGCDEPGPGHYKKSYDWLERSKVIGAIKHKG